MFEAESKLACVWLWLVGLFQMMFSTILVFLYENKLVYINLIVISLLSSFVVINRMKYDHDMTKHFILLNIIITANQILTGVIAIIHTNYLYLLSCLCTFAMQTLLGVYFYKHEISPQETEYRQFA